jgi:hypothetical protein
MDIEQLKETFNLTSLKPKVEEGFDFMVLMSPFARLCYLEWTEKNDPEMLQSRCVGIERRNYGGICGGVEDVVLFKDRSMAENFCQSTDEADKQTGVLLLKGADLDPAPAPQLTFEDITARLIRRPQW